MNKKLSITALLGASAVGIGAFGAHGLKPLLTPDQLQSYKTAVEYQFIHVLAMLFVILWSTQNSKFTTIIWSLFLTGIFLFSGSVYLLTTKDIHQMPISFIGPITPIGGICFMLGWILLSIQALQKK